MCEREREDEDEDEDEVKREVSFFSITKTQKKITKKISQKTKTTKNNNNNKNKNPYQVSNNRPSSSSMRKLELWWSSCNNMMPEHRWSYDR